MNKMTGTWIATSPDKSQQEKYVFNENGTYVYSTFDKGKWAINTQGKFTYTGCSLTLNYTGSTPGSATYTVGSNNTKMCMGFKNFYADENTLSGVWLLESINVNGTSLSDSTEVKQTFTVTIKDNKYNLYGRTLVNGKDATLSYSEGSIKLVDEYITIENDGNNNTAYFEAGTYPYYLFGGVLTIINETTWASLFIRQ